ncbi:MAG: UvrD-helicase domain-containing protein [Planctomycetota bacterium]|jgi:ATP-dependent helicase/nuclease subunit A|nr:UvrD-helicase domain-containing protein [Planctomycetota bacterium]
MADDARPRLMDAAERELILSSLDENIAVEAAAGSGKTTCLVGRLLSLARRGDIAPDTLLAAVTFTRKAAAELRERWRVAIGRAVETATGAERKNLLAASRAVRLCHIGTIHAFAARLLRERPVEAGVDPDFRELDEEEDSLLRDRAWDAFADRVHSGGSSELGGTLRRLDLGLEALRQPFFEFSNYPDMAQWPGEDAPTDLGGWEDFRSSLIDFADTVAGFVAEPVEEAQKEELFGLYRALRAWAARQREASLYSLIRMADQLPAEPEACPKTWKNVFGAACKVGLPEERARYARFYAETAKPFLDRLRAARYAAMLESFRTAREIYDRLRKDAGGLNFQDLLMRAAALLRERPEVRADLARRYPRILVDEVQDTDPIQAEILFLLAGEFGAAEPDWRRARLRPGALFMVGDPKQSIYRFTRADIATYMELKRLLVGNGGRIVRLGVNFRCRAEIVEWVNRTFEPSSASASRRFPENDDAYSPGYAPLIPGRADEESGAFSGVYRLDALPVVRARNRAGLPTRSLADVLRDEAARIARFMRDAVDAPLLIDDRDTGPRPARPDDFLVLTAGKSGVAEIADQLRLLDLPVRVSGRNQFDPDSPLRLLSLAVKAAISPDDPVLQVAVLRSRLFGVSDRELFEWKRRDLPFTRGRGAVSERNGPVAAAFAELSLIHDLFRRNEPSVALREAASRLGVMRLAAEDGGAAGMGAIATVLDRLSEAAHPARTPLEMADALERTLETGEFDILPLEGLDASAVRVMNLHKSKGLEAPVVFLAGSAERREHPPRVCIDRSGPTPRGFLALARGSRLIACPTGWEKREAEEAKFLDCERLRLRYVAATRAGSALVVTAHPSPSGLKSAFLDEVAIDRRLPERHDPAPRPAPAPEELSLAETEEALADIKARSDSVRRPTYRVLRAKECRAETGFATGEPIARDGGPDWTGVHLSPEEATALGEAAHSLLENSAGLDREALTRVAAELLRLAELPEALIDDLVAMATEAGKSEIARRAGRSRRVYRELPFAMSRTGGDGIREIVRGIADLVFEEEDGWVIVDYKSDRHAAGGAQRHAERYRGQLEAYAEAIAKALGDGTVKEKGVLFLRTGEYARL